MIRIIRKFKVSPTQFNPVETLFNLLLENCSLFMSPVGDENQIFLVFRQPGHEVWSAVGHALIIKRHREHLDCGDLAVMR